jgi:hypothetical protein
MTQEARVLDSAPEVPQRMSSQPAKWQYWIEDVVFGEPKDVQNKLSELGEGGWEAVTMYNSPQDRHAFVLLKKPK